MTSKNLSFFYFFKLLSTTLANERKLHKMLLIDDLTIDMHRLGSLSEEGVIRRGESYIALTGSDEPPVKCEMEIGHKKFLQLLHDLRYPMQKSKERVDDALDRLGRLAAKILPDLSSKTEGDPLQIDLVLGAAELWAFPFEACVIDGTPVFVDPARPLILTRRIRQGFAAEKRAWPVRPHVLFIHAPTAGDLPERLIQAHVAALEEALMAWSAKANPCVEGLLQIELALGTGDVKKAVSKAREADSPFTHIHILAHGKAITDNITQEVRWGLRLGYPDRPASDPKHLADALQPQDGLPVVVTVAACDAANQAQTAIPVKSFAQELHGKGVPVVLASQLPLTQGGSVTMTRAFYDPLLRGEDVRLALHKARLNLYEESAGHDWVSMVGYVQLPEGYADYLMAVGVKREMELLKAARSKLDAVEEAHSKLSENADRALDEIEVEVTGRITSLERLMETIPKERKDLRSECHGILASAHKRLAELLFRRGERADQARNLPKKAHCERASIEQLDASLAHYRSAFHGNIQNHWLGVQQLALEAVLGGKFEEARDWDTTFYAAELALAQSEREYWAYGTIAELWLLAPILGKQQGLEPAMKALGRLRKRAKEAGDDYAAVSTRDQLNRYVSWWTTDRGFFGDRGDLAEGAKELLQHLTTKKGGVNNGI
jgi:hypothetical protein